MKKHLLCAGTFLASSFAAFAGALNTTGVPASAEGLLHIDFEAASKSKIGQAIKNSGNTVNLENLEKKNPRQAITLSFLKNTSDFTTALIPNPEGEKDDGESLVILRGNFTQEELLAYAEKLKKDAFNVGKHTFLELPKPLTTTLFTWLPRFVCYFDSKTVVFVSDEKIAAVVLDALSGKAKSYTAPASLTTYGKRVGTPFVLFYLNGKVLPEQNSKQRKNARSMIPPNPSHVFFALGEDAKNVKARLATTYAAEADAQKTQELAQMAIKTARGALANLNGRDGKPDPKKAEEAAKTNKVLDALKIATANPNYFTLSLDYPAEEIAQIIRDAAAREKAASSRE
jgi:hypothetical protein